MKAGWDEVEACTAMATLAHHHILAVLNNRKTDAVLSWACKMQ